MREYRAHETDRMQALDGLVLADFAQRAAAFGLDLLLAFSALMLVLFCGAAVAWAIETGADVNQHRSYNFSLENESFKIIVETLVPVLYFGFLTYIWNGRTPGKRIFGVRVVSLVHQRMSLWHSIERALGYGAAALELGFGFFQFFIHPSRRTVQDRIAETIVVKESSYRARFTAAAKPAAIAGAEAAASHLSG
jgi:uncharacterized RDD family membrane protein YckC